MHSLVILGLTPLIGVCALGGLIIGILLAATPRDDGERDAARKD